MNNIQFLIKLADGYNPITNEKCKDDEVLRNPDVVAKLRKIIAELQNKTSIKKQKKVKIENFKYNPKMAELVKIEEPFLTIQPFAKNIAKATSVGYTVIQRRVQDYLTDLGDLEVRPDPDDDNKLKKYATVQGERNGLVNQTNKAASTGKPYHTLQYTTEGQKYVISLLPEILKN